MKINVYDWCREQKTVIDCYEESTDIIYSTQEFIREFLLTGEIERPNSVIDVYNARSGKFLGFALPSTKVTDPQPIIFVPQIYIIN